MLPPVRDQEEEEEDRGLFEEDDDDGAPKPIKPAVAHKSIADLLPEDDDDDGDLFGGSKPKAQPQAEAPAEPANFKDSLAASLAAQMGGQAKPPKLRKQEDDDAFVSTRDLGEHRGDLFESSQSEGLCQ